MAKVELYVYDLSRGMAKSMSQMLTGKQIDGIWHTSVVVFGREIFYGQGILEARPGTTHHGQPLQRIDCGITHIDEPTFQEYITSLQEMYTAEAYHLMDHNCNNFTADVVGFLTGGTIPSWITGLPAEFLSTPFGQAMKPQIDAMFKRTTPNEHRPGPTSLPTPPASGSNTPLSNSLLNSIAAQATAGPSTPAPTPPNPETSPLSLVTSLTNFTSTLQQHPAVIVNFTNTPTCPPCRMIKPVYEAIAGEHAATYGAKGARFLEVELSVGEGQTIAGKYGIRATPTFLFFKHGKKVDEMKGATKRELEIKVEEFLESVWPRHPHRKIYLSAIEAIPTAPISSTTIPNYSALLGKLESFGADPSAMQRLRSQVVPILEDKLQPSDQALREILRSWNEDTVKMLSTLKSVDTFPVIDLWRVAVSKQSIATLLAFELANNSTEIVINPLSPILSLVSKVLKEQGTQTPKPLLLTTLRLLTNVLASLPLSNLILSSSSPEPIVSLQSDLMSITVESLLHAETTVRSAGAGVAINIASWRLRAAKATSTQPEDRAEEGWEVELVSGLMESISRETDEDTIHRLLAALALTLYLAPGYTETLQPLVEVLGVKDAIESKAKGLKKKEVKKLAEEVASKLCV
ncbi:PPPDE putative peptidase domain-domain-containing protein [Kockovaella imperatae]|uniref:PPPDE putative peptidase domain-domain-containing protein n=1 Tax=Kockovaella imperatae TaxID=4999 RepID=A0A1Y1U9H4_9TREE|nr:PPPDE putative peptidase domain-domain-containing protein [Kockovaella imperatae]ORX34662.1 PPPDE putative peptidase domain-domain-containing protein [Kockovaella imperatae]